MGFRKFLGANLVKQTPPAHISEPMRFWRSSSTSIQWTSTTLHFTMIFPTAFIATLFLTQIACAVAQACHYPISPESSTPEEQFSVTIPRYYTAKYNSTYDNPTGDVGGTACSELAQYYPTFQNIPFFDAIGGVYPFNLTKNSSDCGAIWNLTNIANNFSTNIITIDTIDAPFEFGLSRTAFIALAGLPGGAEIIDGQNLTLTVEPGIVGYLDGE